MRKASSTFSLPVSEARSFAMPASRSERSPASFRRAALRVTRRAASRRGAMSASLDEIAWWWGVGVPDGFWLLAVFERQLQGPLGDADAARGDVDAADLERVHHLREALADAVGAAEDAVRRADVAVVDELGRLDALVAHLLGFRRHGEAGAPAP